MSDIVDVVTTEEVVDVIGVAEAGPPGVGVPPGGLAGRVLVKLSDDDYDTDWANVGSGGGGAYRHIQAVADDVWPVQHDLGFYPNVTPFSSAGDELVGRIEHIDINNLTISFFVGGVPAAFAGEAYCS